MDDGLSKLVAAGSVELENQAEVEAEAAGLSNAEPVPEPKPIEYVDASGLSNLLGSVLNFQYKKQKENCDDEQQLEDPLADENNKNFSLAFLTQFALKGYQADNKVDVTDVEMPHNEKNILKQAGLVKEDIHSRINDQMIATDETSQIDLNIQLFKTIFRAFTIKLRFLALKRPDESKEFSMLPAQFIIRFKLYNFAWTKSETLFLDPLCPEENSQVPILL